MDPLTPEAFAGRIIDACDEAPFVEDYALDIEDNVIVRSRIHCTRGFLEVFRNFETGTTAYAYIVDGERAFGVDNTGGWHRHPWEDPEDHEPCDPTSFGEVLDEISGRFVSG